MVQDSPLSLSALKQQSSSCRLGGVVTGTWGNCVIPSRRASQSSGCLACSDRACAVIYTPVGIQTERALDGAMLWLCVCVRVCVCVCVETEKDRQTDRVKPSYLLLRGFCQYKQDPKVNESSILLFKNLFGIPCRWWFWIWYLPWNTGKGLEMEGG